MRGLVIHLVTPQDNKNPVELLTAAKDALTAMDDNMRAREMQKIIDNAGNGSPYMITTNQRFLSRVYYQLRGNDKGEIADGIKAVLEQHDSFIIPPTDLTPLR